MNCTKTINNVITFYVEINPKLQNNKFLSLLAYYLIMILTVQSNFELINIY